MSVLLAILAYQGRMTQKEWEDIERRQNERIRELERLLRERDHVIGELKTMYARERINQMDLKQREDLLERLKQRETV